VSSGPSAAGGRTGSGGGGTAVAGLLLTGGRSSRLGTDKALLRRPGETTPLAQVLAGRLSAAASPVCEVGPGRTALPQVTGDPGEGPLTAVVAGRRALRALGHDGPVLVLATDLPNVSEELLAWIAGRPEAGSVVPVVAGRPQPLCARWSVADLDRAEALAAGGGRRAREVFGPGTSYLDEQAWGSVATVEQFADVDTPEEADRLGLAPPPGAAARSQSP